MTVMMMVIMVKIKINFKTLPPDANKDFCVLHCALCSPPTLCSSPPTFSQLIVTFLFLPQEKVNLHLRNIFFHETISKLTLQFLHTALLYRRTWHYKSSRNLWIVLVAKSLSVLTKRGAIKRQKLVFFGHCPNERDRLIAPLTSYLNFLTTSCFEPAKLAKIAP